MCGCGCEYVCTIVCVSFGVQNVIFLGMQFIVHLCMHHTYCVFSPFLAAVVCDPPCDNGVCAANDTCQCPSGYSGPTCSQPGIPLHSCTLSLVGPMCAMLKTSLLTSLTA